MNYEISAADLMRLVLLASHMDTENEIGRILMRVSEADMKNGPPTKPDELVPPAKPE